MANAIFENPGNSVEGRIERLQIMRSDGTIRESKRVNIHNTIVNSGLDNILTVGGFDASSNTNNKTLEFNRYDAYNNEYFNGAKYVSGQWIRMLWFMKLGTDTNNTMTLYDMTDLVYIYEGFEELESAISILTGSDTAFLYEDGAMGKISRIHDILKRNIAFTGDSETLYDFLSDKSKSPEEKAKSILP